MAKEPEQSGAAPFQGRWRITAMDLWDREDIDMLGPAIIEIARDRGTMRFIAVEADLDLRYGPGAEGPMAAVSWEGAEEGEPASGRGTLLWKPGDRLDGHIYFHNGDDSAFACVRHLDPGRPRRGRMPSKP